MLPSPPGGNDLGPSIADARPRKCLHILDCLHTKLDPQRTIFYCSTHRRKHAARVSDEAILFVLAIVADPAVIRADQARAARHRFLTGHAPTLHARRFNEHMRCRHVSRQLALRKYPELRYWHVAKQRITAVRREVNVLAELRVQLAIDLTQERKPRS